MCVASVHLFVLSLDSLLLQTPTLVTKVARVLRKIPNWVKSTSTLIKVVHCFPLAVI